MDRPRPPGDPVVDRPGPPPGAPGGAGVERRSRAGRIVGVAVKTLVPIVILGVAGLAFGYLRATRPQVKTTPIQERVWLVGAVTAMRTTVRPTLVLYGKIVAGREVELRPLVAGPVIRVGASFADGGLVRKGDALVVIDPFEYHVAVIERTAQLVEARAKLRQIKTDLTAEQSMIKFDTQQIAIRRRDLARRVDLVKRRSGTEKSLDDARWSLNEQERQLANRRKTIDSLQSQAVQQQAAIDRAEVALRRAQRDLHDTTLKAPFDGVLREISIAVGKRVSVGDKVARLSDAGWLEANFQVTDRQYGRLVASGSVVGRKVVVIWKAGDKTFRYPATIRRVSGRVASGSGGIDLFARLDHTDLKTVLRPGVFVQVQLADVPYVAVFRLPDEAVQAGNIVYVVKNGRLQARTVKIVGRINNDVLVRGALTPGERVVARLFPEIGPGVRVQVP